MRSRRPIAVRLLVLSLGVASALVFTGRGAHSQKAQPDASAAPSGRVPEIEAAVHALLSGRSMKDAVVGVVIMDCESGAVLGQAGEHVVVNPASNAKLYTAAAALAILHGSHRYQTTLSGTIKGTVATGLVLRGRGDPSLRTQDLWAMVTELKARGVRRIEGDIEVDQLFFDEQTTPPAFEQQPNEWASFRAPVSAVALNRNAVTLTVRPQEEGSNAVVSFDPPGFVDFTGTVKTVESGADNVVVELAKGGEGRRLSAKVSGAVAVSSHLVRYTKRVDDPQLMAGYALRSVLESEAIKVAGAVRLGSQEAKSRKENVLVRHQSEPLSTLLYALGKSSDNFYAEMIFKSLAAEAKTRPGRSQDAADIVTKWIDKNDIGDAGVVIKNGSGLFDANRTTAYSMAKLLRFAWQDPAIQSEFVAQLSIGGVDGTLHNRFLDVRSHRAIRAKTGTLDGSIALSGYVLGPHGKGPIAYAILFNNVAGHGGDARVAADKLVHVLHERLWK